MSSDDGTNEDSQSKQDEVKMIVEKVRQKDL